MRKTRRAFLWKRSNNSSTAGFITSAMYTLQAQVLESNSQMWSSPHLLLITEHHFSQYSQHGAKRQHSPLSWSHNPITAPSVYPEDKQLNVKNREEGRESPQQQQKQLLTLPPTLTTLLALCCQSYIPLTVLSHCPRVNREILSKAKTFF